MGGIRLERCAEYARYTRASSESAYDDPEIIKPSLACFMPLFNVRAARPSFSLIIRGRPMPARIVVVHDDPNFRECVVTALQAAGYDIKAFVGSMATIEGARGGHMR